MSDSTKTEPSVTVAMFAASTLHQFGMAGEQLGELGKFTRNLANTLPTQDSQHFQQLVATGLRQHASEVLEYATEFDGLTPAKLGILQGSNAEPSWPDVCGITTEL